MTDLDWTIVGAYVVGVWVIGVLLSRRAGRSTEEYFASGRNLPWWIVGTSMAASAFSADTPQYVAHIVRVHGVARNWEWWGYGIGGVLVAFILAPLWRRVGVLTDLELTELRYPGRAAAALRGFRAIHTGLLLNVIGMAAPVAAMLCLVRALGYLDEGNTDLQLLYGITLVLATLVYSFFGGFWGVIVTDFLQFGIALFAAVAVAFYAVDAAGGLSAVIDAAPVPLQPVDLSVPEDDFWNRGAVPFFVFAGVAWWSFINADGGGKIVQRMIAAKNERHAMWGALWFNITHYALRTWPWVLVGLASCVLLPDGKPELAYVETAVLVLPAGMLGLFVASFVAAYMSTVDTQLNWGASYLVNDFYRRFLVRRATETHYVLIARLATLLLGAATVLLLTLEGAKVIGYLRLALTVSAGYGIALLARWFWWRPTAVGEIVALSAALAATVAFRVLDLGWPYPKVLLAVTAFTAGAWLLVTLFSKPTPPERLVAFYRRARPPGFWGPVAALAPDVEVEPLRGLGDGLAGLALVFGATLGLGGALLGLPGFAVGGLGSAILGGIVLVRRQSKERSD